MRRQSVVLSLALLASFGAARAEVVIDETAPTAPQPVTEYYSQPAVPSIVFVSPEAREAGMAWLPSNTPYVPRAPLLLNLQQQPISPVAGGVVEWP